jgi:hypothetical protein
MQRRSQLLLIAAALTLAFCFSTRQARANSATISGCSNCNGYSFQATITPVSGSPGQYAVTYTVTNVNGAAAIPYNWSLTAFSNGNAVSSSSNLSVAGSSGNYTSDYVVMHGKSNNGNTNCNGNVSNAFCVQQTGSGPFPVLNAGQFLTFSFDITCNGCSLTSSWYFLASGNPRNNRRGNVYAISNWGAVTSMPEPSVVALYISTVAAGLVVAWRKRAVRRSSD